MTSPDPRNANVLLTMDERKDIRRSIAEAEADMQRITADITKLLEQQEKVADKLFQLKNVLVIHRLLPKETISYIFSLLRPQKIPIPHNRRTTPPQIIVSHVCSKWREIALATPSLWRDVEITQPASDQWVQVATELLFDRAGTRGVNLALDFINVDSREMGSTFYNIILPLHVKKLHLTLPLSKLESLSQESNEMMVNIDEIALDITTSNFGPFSLTQIPTNSSQGQVSIEPQFLSKIRSLRISRWGNRSSFVRQLDSQNLPWAQIRSLNCGIALTISTISNILRQSPVLEVCEIRVEPNDEVESTTALILPQLRIFHINHMGPLSDPVLRSFMCSNLTDLRLEFLHWTPETYKIIENHYNLRQLLKFEVARFPYPISKVLHDAPMLQELIVTYKVFVDESALQGISSGKLGRFLTSLGLLGKFNARKVLNMVAFRQSSVEQIIEAGRSWQDQISGIKQIFVLNDGMENYALVKEFKEKADELEKKGTIVYQPDDGLASGSEEPTWPRNGFGLSWQNVCDPREPPIQSPLESPASGSMFEWEGGKATSILSPPSGAGCSVWGFGPGSQVAPPPSVPAPSFVPPSGKVSGKPGKKR